MGRLSVLVALLQDKGMDMFTEYLQQGIRTAAEESHTALVENAGERCVVYAVCSWCSPRQEWLACGVACSPTVSMSYRPMWDPLQLTHPQPRGTIPLAEACYHHGIVTHSIFMSSRGV